jgi:hypothetical protein
MGLFSKSEKWEESFRINSRDIAGRRLCGVLFWLWGLGGFILVLFEFSRMPNNVGVGTSAAVAAECLMWIGGMVLFGLGAMIASPDFSAVKRVEDYGDVRVGR